MNNLTTRKIVLGMLIAFVLAFSVQGIADAETVTRRSSDDLEVRDIGDSDEFDVSFSVSDVEAGDTLVIPAVSGLTLKKIGGHTVPSTETGSITLSPGDEDYEELENGNYTVEYSVDSNASAGAENIRISGITYTVYVVNDAATTSATGVDIREDDGNNPALLVYEVRGDQHSRIFINVEAGDSLPITIKVSGGGKVYVREGSRQTSEDDDLDTSSDAPIFLNMKSKTNKVTVSVPGLGSYTATYIFGNPRLQKIGDTDQMGIAGGRLEEPLGVKLEDFGGGDISGVPVTFSAVAGTFTPVPGKTLYESNGDIRTATSTRPATFDPTAVYTDSKGEAYAYYEFADNADGIVNVTVTLPDTRATTTFTPEVEDPTRRPTLAKLSGDNQRTDEEGDIEDPLVVIVKRGGNLKPSEMVTFRTVKGSLVNSEGVGVKRVIVTTDGSGEAEVTYYQDTGGR